VKAPRGGSPQPAAPVVKPWLAALASLLVPGLGQVLARRVQRGLIILASVASIVGMLAWRISILGHLAKTPLDMFLKAFQRQPLFLGLVLACFLFVWLGNVLDARRQARGRRGGFLLFALVLFTFFALGWQISEIDLARLVTDFPQAMQPLGRVVWPWQAAVTRDPVVVKAGAPIRVPCGNGSGPPSPPEEQGKPHLSADPGCGVLSKLDADNNILPGSTITLTGKGFHAGAPVEIWWVDPLSNAFQLRRAGSYLTVDPDSQGSFRVEVVMPYALVPSSQGKEELHRVEARQTTGWGPMRASEPLQLVVARMIETIFMGMMATLFGIVLAIPVSFLGARNIMSGSRLTMAVYYLARTFMNIVRSIEPLIWALIAVVWVGLGPFAGIVALTVHSVAALGKLYSEAIESIDPGPIEAINATGATRLQAIVYAVVPQMIAPFVSFSIYRWDVNVRMSTVIGLVGGGGIGFILVQYIRLLDYRAAGIAVWFIAVTVAVLDYVSAEIRARFV
jgi:phosphonate transport system permease protein